MKFKMASFYQFYVGLDFVVELTHIVLCV